MMVLASQRRLARRLQVQVREHDRPQVLIFRDHVVWRTAKPSSVGGLGERHRMRDVNILKREACGLVLGSLPGKCRVGYPLMPVWRWR